MGDFFPFLYFPEDYFPGGYFGENVGTGTTFADAALVAVGSGSAVVSARGTARSALEVVGTGSAQITAQQPDVPLPATPEGGSSGGFGRLWMEARRRRYADAELIVMGVGSAEFSPVGEVRVALLCGGTGSAVMEAVTAKREQARNARRNSEMELWLLAA